jgi:hypothetical protein
MSEYILYDISGIQPIVVGYKAPYYKYDDIVISAEAAEDIRQWAMNGLTEHIYQDVDLSDVDPDKLKELEDIIDSITTY